MSNISNLSDTIIPKSDQLNAEQLISGDMTITVTAVSRGLTPEQPIIINYDGDNGRPYKPCKSMRKVLIFAWGSDGNKWVGRSMTLFNKADVKFGGVEVGGIRISHLSDIEKDIKMAITSTKGKKEQQFIKLLEKENFNKYFDVLLVAANQGMDKLKSAWAGLPANAKKFYGNCPEELKNVANNFDKAHQKE